MRATPFDDETPGPQGEGWKAHTINLAEHLKQTARDNTAGGATQPAAVQPGTEEKKEGTEQPAAPGAGTFDDGKPAEAEQGKSEFKKMVEGFENENDPKTLAKILVQLGNVGRIFFVPGMYFKLTYPGQEAYDLKNVIDKSVENEKQNKAPDTGFNDYEKRLYHKLPKLRAAQENCSYTQPEIDELAGFLEREIARLTVAVWMARYMWIIYILYLEAKHAQPLIEQKGADFFNSKFPTAK